MQQSRAVTRNIDGIPYGDLGIVALSSCQAMGNDIDRYIVRWRREREAARRARGEETLEANGRYSRSSYLVPNAVPRFGSGEAKGQIFDSVRGDDLYLIVDICNYSITYTMNGIVNHMSPDDHFQDLKRVIAAIGGKARRITVIMPFLYESRQLTRSGRESLDCAIALQELINMGVNNIVTFESHDPRVMNAIPLFGFENYHTGYQFIKGMYSAIPDLKVSPDRLMVVSPDENGTKRAIYMANILGVDMGMFYKRRDYTRWENGQNPVVSYEFLGGDVRGKDMVIIDDMISSGDTVLEVAAQLRAGGAGRILICSAFGFFTRGMEEFDQAYARGDFQALLTTNLIYQPPELLARPYYTSCDMSKFIALIIDTMNHNGSVSTLLDPVDRIQSFLEEHNPPVAK